MIVYGKYYYYPLETKRCESGFYGKEIPPVNKTSRVGKCIREDNYKFYCKNLNRKTFSIYLKNNYYKMKKIFLEDKINKCVLENINTIEKKLLYLLNKPTYITYTKKGVVKKYDSIFLDVKV